MGIGGLHLGVRASAPGVLGVVAEAFRPYVAHGVDAPANLSVQVGAQGRGGMGNAFHVLHRDGRRALRTRDPHRLARALVAELSSHERIDEELVRLPGVALVRDGEALVACLAVRSSLDRIERRLNAAGLLLVDQPWIHLDPLRAEVVVPEPAIEVDWPALAALEEVVGGPHRKEPIAAPGRYRLRGWTFVLAEERPAPLPLARAVLWAALLASDLAPERRGEAVGRLAQLAGVVRPTAVSWREVASGAWCER